jgi:predicted Zn finger-like uncharacterized protein
MEVRCGNCSKLFRVSDDKITGSGIKFACSRCGEFVKITKEDFEQYNLSKATASVLASSVLTPPKPSPAATKQDQQIPAAAVDMSFAFSESPVLDLPHEEQAPPLFVKPAPLIESEPEPAPIQPKAEPKKEPKIEPRIEPKVEPMPAVAAPQPEAATKAEAEPKPEPFRTAAPAASSAPEREAARPTPSVIAASQVAPAASSGTVKKLLVFIAVLLVIIGAAAFGAKWYFGRASQQVSDAVKAVTTPEGLQILNASGAMDPIKGDLVISGVVENSTDKPKPAWYVVADVYDAQGTVLVKAKFLSGKQLYTRRDYDILLKRGVNIQDLKAKNLQEQGVIIPPKGTVNFEIHIMEPPVGIVSFNATLQPFDPVQLFKEMVEEQKQQ